MHENGQAFLLYMAHYAIHTPVQPDMRFYQKYLDKGLPPVEAAYATLIEGMDKSLGDLMDYLDKNNLTITPSCFSCPITAGWPRTPVPDNRMCRTTRSTAERCSAYEGGCANR